MEKNGKDIKRDILQRFRTMIDDRLVLSGLWLRKEYINKLSNAEKETFEIAVGELASNGLLEYNKSPYSSLRLTEKGANLIF